MGYCSPYLKGALHDQREPEHHPCRESIRTQPPMIGTAVTLAAAFAGGLLSFASPCVLPIVPAYLAVVTGVSGPVILGGGRSHLRRVLVTALGFMAGFTVVFVLLGLSITAVGQALAVNRVVLGRISGLVVLAMALFLLASLVLRAPLPRVSLGSLATEDETTAAPVGQLMPEEGSTFRR
jgi:cytochrome c biogenesis protein CcdA